MKTVSTVVIAIATLALASGAVLAQNGNDLFQQALVKERTEGNFTEAIKLYQTIVQKYGSDRKLAAKALFQMGQAYEKLGNAEARKTYERIAREFADQKEVAADAGRRLTALSVPPIFDGPFPRLVMNPANRYDTTAISLDGRSMVVVRWLENTVDRSIRELTVQDISTGELKRVVPGSCPKPRACAFPLVAFLSPDSRQIAYSWWDNGSRREELRVVANDAGAKPRVLASRTDWSLYPIDWTPDGKSILVGVLHAADRTWQLMSFSAADGSPTVLKSLE